MTIKPYDGTVLDDAATDRWLSAAQPDTAQTRSAAYRLAYQDGDFLVRDGLRPLRFQMELLKPEMLLDDAGILSTFVIYGSARIPADDSGTPHGMSRHYAEARALARLAGGFPPEADGKRHFVVCSGGGPSIMEAANRGAADVGSTSIGLNIVLPMEQVPNAFVSPELCFQFHYFALRKMHFILRARAVAVFPGGFGTLDELFDLLTLMQTFWRKVIDFDALVEAGMVASRDLQLIRFVTDAQAAWAEVEAFYRQHPEPVWHKRAPGKAA